MSYPPRNAKRPSELGTSAPAKRQVIDRRADPYAAPTSLSTTDRTNRAIHTHIATADELWEVVAQAAQAASDDQTTCACKILWKHLDPPLAGKSAAVKAAVQALCLDQLLAPSKKLPARLAEWFAMAREVAAGAHALFVQGVRGWDEGLDCDTHKVIRDERGDPRVSKMTYWPFETYDRTLENPLYARCFGDSEAQSQRSRVKLVDLDVAKTWHAAEAAHRSMLDMEAYHELFLPSDALSNEGLTIAELGGLFLLTNLSDNWAKRTELFDLDFWTLRMVHFGLERNLGLRMNQFCLDTLARAAASPRASPNTPPEPFLRHSFPDPMRSRCWLENALHCIVALKVHLFLKLRWAAYDDAKGEQVLNEQVLLDRHDIEQSKAHWLPSARPKSTEISPILNPAASSVAIPPLAPPLPPPVAPVAPVAPPALHEALLQRLCEHGAPVSGREALAMLASERFLLLQRIEALDRMVGMHLEVHRLLEQEHQKQSETAMQKLAVLTAAMDAPNLSNPEATRLAAEFAAISESFTLKASSDAALEGVRRRVQARGMQLRAVDSVWAMHANREAVSKLVAVGVGRATERETMLGLDEEFNTLFGTGNGTLSVARCDPNDGWCRSEAIALLERLVHVLASEAALQHRLRSLDVLVPVPLACCVEVSLAKVNLGIPQRSLHKSLRLYAQLHKKQTERSASLNIMANTCATAMAKAIERAFTTCLAECSDPTESDIEFGDTEEQLKMPDRLYACQRKVASAVVHSFLNVAHLYGGLRIVHDDDLSEEDDQFPPPVIVYNATAAQLSMPNPVAIVERHWPAAQHLLDLAVCVEPWIRDRRRRLPCLLAIEEHLVTLSAKAGPCVHATHRAAALARLEAAEDAQQQRYWPAWPPTEADLVTAERLETTLKWGRHATLHALRSAAPRLVLPPEPYRSVPPARTAGYHAWLHRAHLKCAPVVEVVPVAVVEDDVDSDF
jgi:hypothetical protein